MDQGCSWLVIFRETTGQFARSYFIIALGSLLADEVILSKISSPFWVIILFLYHIYPGYRPANLRANRATEETIPTVDLLHETTLPETDCNRKLHSEIGQTPLDRFLAKPLGDAALSRRRGAQNLGQIPGEGLPHDLFKIVG